MDRQIDMHYLLCLLPGLPGPHQLGLVLSLLQDGLVARLELVLKDDNLIQRPSHQIIITNKCISSAYFAIFLSKFNFAPENQQNKLKLNAVQYSAIQFRTVQYSKQYKP